MSVAGDQLLCLWIPSRIRIEHQTRGSYRSIENCQEMLVPAILSPSLFMFLLPQYYRADRYGDAAVHRLLQHSNLLYVPSVVARNSTGCVVFVELSSWLPPLDKTIVCGTAVCQLHYPHINR